MNNTIRLSIPAMKCNGCVAAIEKALADEKSVTEAVVDLASKSAVLTSTVSADVVLGVIKAAGFDASLLPAEAQDLS